MDTPPKFRSRSLTEAIALIAAGDRKCSILADLLGRCVFLFEDTVELRRDLDQLQSGGARIEPFRFMRIRSQLRTKMDEAVSGARAEAESNTEGRALLARIEHERRTEEVLNLPNPWKAIRTAQREAEARGLAQRLTGIDQASKPWQRGTVWGPGSNSDTTTEGA